MSEPKKPTKRSRTRFPGLVHEVNPRTRWENIDHDYVDQLSDKEKEWLSNFNEEYLSGNFNHKGKKFHRSKQSKRDCYNRNNARNRDLFTLFRSRGWMTGFAETGDDATNRPPTNVASQEDAVIALIDIKNNNEEKD